MLDRMLWCYDSPHRCDDNHGKHKQMTRVNTEAMVLASGTSFLALDTKNCPDCRTRNHNYVRQIDFEDVHVDVRRINGILQIKENENRSCAYSIKGKILRSYAQSVSITETPRLSITLSMISQYYIHVDVLPMVWTNLLSRSPLLLLAMSIDITKSTLLSLLLFQSLLLEFGSTFFLSSQGFLA